jgi:hypothetical protein
MALARPGEERKKRRDARRGTRNLISLLRTARFLVRVVCGDLLKEMYEDTELVDELGKAIGKRGLRVVVLVGPAHDHNTAEKLRTIGCIVVELKTRPLVHYAIGDLERVRLEGIHREGEPIPANSVLRRGVRTASYLSEQFSDLYNS